MQFVREFLSRRGYEVVRTRRSALTELLKSRQIDHVIDVGANRGQFCHLVRQCGYRGPISAFEPIAELKPEIAVHSPITITTTAVGRECGRTSLKIYSSHDFSSMHELSPNYGREYENAPTVIETREVDVVALDELSLAGRRKLLKIDTQGSDAEVLRGARETLESVAVLYLELPFMRIYEQGCSVATLFELTEAAGLLPARFFANSITSWGAWVDGDVIFVKRLEPQRV